MNILNKFTIRHLKLNKKRTIVTIIGVILSTALMVGIGLLLSTVRDSMIKEAVNNSGNHHVVFEDIEYKNQNLLTLNDNVKEVNFYQTLGYASYNLDLEKDYNEYIKVVKGNEELLSKLTVMKGKLPTNNSEIVINEQLISEYEVGDTLTLDYGIRYDGEEPLAENEYGEEERLEIIGSKTYTIVGVVKFNYFAKNDVGEHVYTLDSFNDDSTVRAYVEYKDIRKTYDYTESIGKSLGYLTEEDLFSNVDYNNSLLALSGVSKYDNFISSVSSILVIILSLISIACVVVIYNSFAISVMERKKYFGLLSSVGTTKKQTRATVFFEAFIVGVIGIPLGIAGSYLGIGIVLEIINNLLPDIFVEPLRLTTYPLFVIIPLIFMILVILFAALMPARRASKFTPIELIRQSDDIKIKKSKLRVNPIVKFFGIEGEIAYKNMKRNKRKYRITIASLFISIVLFVSFSSLMDYGLLSTTSYLGGIDIDVQLYYEENEENKKYMEEVLNSSYIDEQFGYVEYYYPTDTDFNNVASEDFKKYFNGSVYSDVDSTKTISIYVVDNEIFSKLLGKENSKNPKPLYYNNFQATEYSNNSRKVLMINRLKQTVPINLLKFSYNEETNDYVSNVFATIEDYYLFSGDYLGSIEESYRTTDTIIISEDMRNDYINEFDKEYNSQKTVNLKVNNKKEFIEYLKKPIESNELNINYTDIASELETINNTIFIMKLLIYGFITLVTLIGVTSVFNTIHTSISLRRKEFSMLRSMGLTSKGMNKMLAFETIFVGLKSLFFALPVSIGVTLLIHNSLTDIVSFKQLMIPWESMLVASLSVFIIVMLSMSYASRRIKHENILEAIRNENI